MYNAARKEEYLWSFSNDNSRKSMQKIFNNVEELEEEYNKDLCDFSKGELFYFLEEKTGVGDCGSSISLIRSYTNWCIDRGLALTYKNLLEEIKPSDIDKRKKFHTAYVGNSDEFEEMLSVVFEHDESYNASTENAKELIIRLAYLGLENEEITHLKKDMIDYENCLIQSPIYPDFEYLASDKIMSLCKYCTDQTVELYNSKNGIVRKERLCENEYMLRQRIGTLRGNSEDRPINASIVIRRVQEFSKKYGVKTGIVKEITAEKLRESGLFHEIQEADDKDEYINNGIKTELLLKKPDISQRQLNERLRKIKKSYHTWAAAFQYPNFDFERKNRTKLNVFEKINAIYTMEREKKDIHINQYSRNRTLVQELKNIYGCRCQLCKSEEYFDIKMQEGMYYTEVHHIVSNAEGVDEEGTLDRPGNMIVVCPNHHKYLHYNLGGNYKLTEENGVLYLANDFDKIKVQTDLHLKKYGFNE